MTADPAAEPRTAAGRALLDGHAASASFRNHLREYVIAIEAEAAQPTAPSVAPDLHTPHDDWYCECGHPYNFNKEDRPVGESPALAGLDGEGVNKIDPERLAEAMHAEQCPRGIVVHMVGTPGFHCGDAERIARRLAAQEPKP